MSEWQAVSPEEEDERTRSVRRERGFGRERGNERMDGRKREKNFHIIKEMTPRSIWCH